MWETADARYGCGRAWGKHAKGYPPERVEEGWDSIFSMSFDGISVCGPKHQYGSPRRPRPTNPNPHPQHASTINLINNQQSTINNQQFSAQWRRNENLTPRRSGTQPHTNWKGFWLHYKGKGSKAGRRDFVCFFPDGGARVPSCWIPDRSDTAKAPLRHAHSPGGSSSSLDNLCQRILVLSHPLSPSRPYSRHYLEALP